MLELLQILSLLLVVLALVPALAHALEFPGKRRLAKEAYFAVQPIYYPGFTIAGISEPVALIVMLALLAFMPRQGSDFWLTLTALLALAGMHAVYWLRTHPVNKFWLRDEQLGGAGSAFFATGTGNRLQKDSSPVEWTILRDRWEYSHIMRAVLAFLSLLALVIAVA